MRESVKFYAYNRKIIKLFSITKNLKTAKFLSYSFAYIKFISDLFNTERLAMLN